MGDTECNRGMKCLSGSNPRGWVDLWQLVVFLINENQDKVQQTLKKSVVASGNMKVHSAYQSDNTQDIRLVGL